MRSNSNADAPHQGERPQFCCHQRHDTTARLEGQTLAENQYRKKKSDFRKDISMRKIKFISILLVLSMLLTVRLRKKSHPVFGGMALGSIRG